MSLLYAGFARAVMVFASAALRPNSFVRCSRKDAWNSAHIPIGIPKYFTLSPLPQRYS